MTGERGWTFARRLESRNAVFITYAAVAVLATLSKTVFGSFEFHGLRYAEFQNFVIYRNAFFHLVRRQGLYGPYPVEQWDLFKYTPTFALLMGPIAVLPSGLGVFLWNLLNALGLAAGLWAVPALRDRAKAVVLWFALLSMVTSIQNAQSNALVAGLMLGGWAAQEREKPLVASLCVVLCAFIKPFGAVMGLPCLLGRGRGNFLVGGAVWSLLLIAAPLAVVSPTQLGRLYQGWLQTLEHDGATNLGISLMGVFTSTTHFVVPAPYIVGIGAAVLVLVALLRSDAAVNAQFRGMVAASVLIWVVIFNHMAESPTMVIAVTGVGLWSVLAPSRVNLVLAALSFVLTSLSPTDLTPSALHRQPLLGYLEAVPCILAWGKLQYDLLGLPRRSAAETA